jgi:hypothetical protein
VTCRQSAVVGGGYLARSGSLAGQAASATSTERWQS